MTVAELIRQLQQFREDANVKIEFATPYSNDGSYGKWEDVLHGDEQTPTVTIVKMVADLKPLEKSCADRLTRLIYVV